MDRSISFFIGITIFLGSLSAEAANPVPREDQMPTVRRLSLKFERELRRAINAAEREADPSDRRESLVLRDFQKVEDRTTDFVQAVRIYFDAPEYTDRDYRRLVWDYSRVKSQFHVLKAYRTDRFLFHEFQKTFREISFYYSEANQPPDFF